MEPKEFTEKFREQFIDADEIQVEMETQFRQLPTWDSLTGMSVLVMIQDEYGVEMTDKDLKACNSVSDILEFIRSKK